MYISYIYSYKINVREKTNGLSLSLSLTQTNGYAHRDSHAYTFCKIVKHKAHIILHVADV